LSLPRDLLDQARHLVGKEPKRPKQASLRRAVSTAYYALFHLLTEAAAARLVTGGAREQQALRMVVRRAFSHGDMKRASVSFAGGSAPAEWQTALATAGVTADVRLVASAFHDLQGARHEADYNLGRIYTRREAQEFVRRCEDAFDAWARCRKAHDAEVFLAALLLHARLKGSKSP
jgi:hypothetical protein